MEGLFLGRKEGLDGLYVPAGTTLALVPLLLLFQDYLLLMASWPERI